MLESDNHIYTPNMPAYCTNPDTKWRTKLLKQYQKADPVENGYRISHAQKDLASTERGVL